MNYLQLSLCSVNVTSNNVPFDKSTYEDSETGGGNDRNKERQEMVTSNKHLCICVTYKDER